MFGKILYRMRGRNTEMSEYINVSEIFGEDVFDDEVMQQRLPKKVYKDLKQTILEGKELSRRWRMSLLTK